MAKLSAERLAALIREAVTEPSYRRRAEAIADHVREEDSSGRGVYALDRG